MRTPGRVAEGGSSSPIGILRRTLIGVTVQKMAAVIQRNLDVESSYRRWQKSSNRNLDADS